MVDPSAGDSPRIVRCGGVSIVIEPEAEWRLRAAVTRKALGARYLRRKWLPRKGPAFVTLVEALRGHCWSRDEEHRDWCYISVGTLARETGISERSIYRLFNDPEMGWFVTRFQRRRYSPQHQCQVQTSNLYLVTLEDPPVPEDEAHYAAVEAAMRATWGQETETSAESAPSASTASQTHEDTVVTPARLVAADPATLGSQNALPLWQSVSSANMADESDSLNLDVEGDVHRFDTRGVERWNTHQEKEGASPDATEEATEALEQAQHVAEYILSNFGDVRPALGASGLVRALQRAETPVEVMCELLRVARARVRRRQSRAGTESLIRNKAAYFMRTAEQLAREAARVGWDVAAIGEQDWAGAVGA